jgi:hypothetical protein
MEQDKVVKASWNGLTMIIMKEIGNSNEQCFVLLKKVEAQQDWCMTT